MNPARLPAFRAMFQPPGWVTGGISTGDAEFLLDLVLSVQPEIIVEIGVAAGTSAAALLYALDQLPGGAHRVLYSVDVRATCYFDRQYATGAAVAVMYPDHRHGWILHTGADARRVCEHLQPGSIDLIFIDGNHRHPWPLLDLLHLAPWARPEAWIALHDIRLAHLQPRFQAVGAEWLFTAWPGEKNAGKGDAENIGAVRLPADLATLNAMAIALIRRQPWEDPPGAQPSRADVDLSDVFAPTRNVLRQRLRPAGGRRHA